MPIRVDEEAAADGGFRSRSGGQAVTAFCTATLENQAATFGRHPGAETMGPFAFQVARLKCAFHCVPRTA